MDKQQFYETYCMCCGTQQCGGIDDEEFSSGCLYRWNLDGADAATEIIRLNDKIMELAGVIMKLRAQGMWKIIDNNEYGFEVQCSNCQHKAFFSNPSIAKFCSNCGADMRGATPFEEIKTGLQQAINYEKEITNGGNSDA